MSHRPLKSKSSRIAIFTSGGKNIGYGHVSRCSALAESLIESGSIVSVYVSGVENPSELFPGCDCSRADWFNDPSFCLMAAGSCSVVIFDSYLPDAAFFTYVLSRISATPVFFDDKAEYPYPRGVVINSSPVASTMYGKPWSHLALLCGIEFLALRQPFWKIQKRPVRKELTHLVLTFGGDDVRELLPVLYRNLRALTKAKISLVCGGFSKSLETVKALVGINDSLLVDLDAAEIAKLFCDADLSICGGGQTSYEFLCCGTPIIPIQISDNQRGGLVGLRSLGLISSIFEWDQPDLIARIIDEIERVSSAKVREEISSKGMSLVDGQGCRRIASALNRGIVQC